MKPSDEDSGYYYIIEECISLMHIESKGSYLINCNSKASSNWDNTSKDLYNLMLGNNNLIF
jgi:hypothetical protein